MFLASQSFVKSGKNIAAFQGEINPTSNFMHSKMDPAKTCRSTRTAFASELGVQGPLGALVSYY